MSKWRSKMPNYNFRTTSTAWRRCGISCSVRPADEHIKETKFWCNDKTSQQTKERSKNLLAG